MSLSEVPGGCDFGGVLLKSPQGYKSTARHGAPQPVSPISKLPLASYSHPSEGRQNENQNHRNQ